MKFKDTFSIRADIDSLTGLQKGIPAFLQMLEEKEMKASIYSIVGWEGDFSNVLKYRILKKKKTSMPHSGNAFSPSLAEISRMLFFPKPFFKEENFSLIKKQGHELGVHGFVHVKWNFPDNQTVRQEFDQMLSAFNEAVREFPKSYSIPLEAKSELADKLALEKGFLCKSYVGNEVLIKKNGKHKMAFVPITINKSPTCQPIIEQLLSEGKSEKETVQIVREEIEKKVNEKKLASFYIHPELEALKCPKVLEEVLDFVNELGLKTKTSMEIAKEALKKN